MDDNGVIDKVEFRNLLTMLQLGYSDKRFNRLFKAVDIRANGKIGIAELETLLFPTINKKKKSISSFNKSLSTINENKVIE